MYVQVMRRMQRDSRRGWLVNITLSRAAAVTYQSHWSPITVLCPPLQVKVTKQHNEECQRLLSLMGIPFIAVSTNSASLDHCQNGTLCLCTQCHQHVNKPLSEHLVMSLVIVNAHMLRCALNNTHCSYSK